MTSENIKDGSGTEDLNTADGLPISKMTWAF